MSTCDTPGCAGHLGKFQSCLAEAIWEISLESAEDTTGATDFEGHFALMVFDQDDTQQLEGGPLVTIPAGSYIVESTNSGAVYLLTYDSEDEARAVFAVCQAAYEAWDSEDADVPA